MDKHHPLQKMEGTYRKEYRQEERVVAEALKETALDRTHCLNH